jgi:uncharacterized membrane protein YfcA
METILIIAAAFAIGGILKGATGFGAPILAIPLLALFFDVPFAVTIFSIPNLLPNVWQSWAYRKHRLPLKFLVRFMIAGALGAAIGTYMLANVPSDILSLGLAGVITAYIILRIIHPSWCLRFPIALKLVAPVGLFGGILQASSGLSAPLSITFLNAMKLEREQFVSTIAMFFVSLGVVQIPLLKSYGYLSWENFALSCAALVPLVVFMPVGARLARHVSREMFDKIILIILSVLCIKLYATSLF